MRTNEAGLAIIRGFEGFEAAPYRCPAGVWTIGYGSTRTPEGAPVTAETGPITEAEAAAWMARDLERYERAVEAYVTVPVNDNQFSALVSFTYNLGSGNLRASTLRQKLNRGDYEGAAGEFPKWRRAGGRVLKGLVRRRAAERALFLS